MHILKRMELAEPARDEIDHRFIKKNTARYKTDCRIADDEISIVEVNIDGSIYRNEVSQ